MIYKYLYKSYRKGKIKHKTVQRFYKWNLISIGEFLSIVGSL